MNIVQLGDLVSIQTGKLDANASSADGAYPFFTCAREPLKIANWKYDLDAILIAGNGDLNIKHYKGKFDAYQRTYILSAKNSNVDTRYLYHFLDKYLDRLREQSIGGIIKYIKLGMLTEAPIPLPPLDEQKKIAAILDQADELRRKRRRAVSRLNHLGQAIFFEMFDTSNKDAHQERLGALTTKIGSGATPKGGDNAYKASGTPLIRSMNVRDGHFLERGLAYIDDEQAEKLSNVIVREGDVLLNITGASVARVCRAPKNMDGARVNQHVIIIRSTDHLSNEFLEAFLLMPRTKTRLLTIAESGATRQAITKAQIEELLIPVPLIDEQLKFSLKAQLAKINLSTMADQSQVIDQLFSSLQHRAFRGEL